MHIIINMVLTWQHLHTNVNSTYFSNLPNNRMYLPIAVAICIIFCGLRTSPLSTPVQNHSKLIQGDAVETKQTCSIINTFFAVIVNTWSVFPLSCVSLTSRKCGWLKRCKWASLTNFSHWFVSLPLLAVVFFGLQVQSVNWIDWD